MDTTYQRMSVVEGPLVARLRKRLEAWLDRKNWKTAKLLDWLKGYELPAVGHDEEPYVWLLRALSRSDESHRREMALRLAHLLNEKRPYQHVNGEYDDEFLYNLFYLCSGLRRRDELGEPLYQVYKFFNENERGQALLSERSRYNLSGALRDALIMNQVDQQFSEVWEGMIEGQPHSLLRGSRYTGAEGLLYMPHSAAETDKPAVEKIGLALARMAHDLEPESDRHRVFRHLIERVREVWPGYQHWDRDLLQQAIRQRWPTWAVMRLDNLAVQLDRTDNTEHFLLWGFYLSYLNSSEPSLQPLNYSLNGLVAEVRLKLKTSYLLNMIRPCVEEARRECPDGSDKNIRLAASEALNVLMGDYWQKRRRTGRKRARRLRSSSPTCTRAGSTPSSRRGLTISRRRRRRLWRPGPAAGRSSA